MKSDVVSLVDVFERISKTADGEYDINPFNFVSLPRSSWVWVL